VCVWGGVGGGGGLRVATNIKCTSSTMNLPFCYKFFGAACTIKEREGWGLASQRH
jgi:hypothetical protein